MHFKKLGTCVLNNIFQRFFPFILSWKHLLVIDPYSNATTLISWLQCVFKVQKIQQSSKGDCNLSSHNYISGFCCVFLGLHFDTVMADMTCSCFWPSSHIHASQHTDGNTTVFKTHSGLFEKCYICFTMSRMKEHVGNLWLFSLSIWVGSWIAVWITVASPTPQH